MDTEMVAPNDCNYAKEKENSYSNMNCDVLVVHTTEAAADRYIDIQGCI